MEILQEKVCVKKPIGSMENNFFLKDVVIEQLVLTHTLLVLGPNHLYNHGSTTAPAMISIIHFVVVQFITFAHTHIIVRYYLVNEYYRPILWSVSQLPYIHS